MNGQTGSGAPGAGSAPSGPPPQGRYVGEATVTSNPYDATCDNAPIKDFFVRGNIVQMGGFLGTIRPDGRVEMQAGPRYISGRFVGSQFTGQMSDVSPACWSSFSLRPA